MHCCTVQCGSSDQPETSSQQSAAHSLLKQIRRQKTTKAVKQYILLAFKITPELRNINKFSTYIIHDIYFWISSYNKKASIRWQDSARRQFQAGLRGDVGL